MSGSFIRGVHICRSLLVELDTLSPTDRTKTKGLGTWAEVDQLGPVTALKTLTVGGWGEIDSVGPVAALSTLPPVLRHAAAALRSGRTTAGTRRRTTSAGLRRNLATAATVDPDLSTTVREPAYAAEEAP